MIRYVSLLSLLCMLCSFVSSAQEFHDPTEVLKIMTDSPKKYSVSIDSTLQADTMKTLVLEHLVLRTRKDGSKELTTYQDIYGENKEHQEAYAKAEEYFTKGDMEKAREYYKKALEFAPDQSMIMTYVGQTHGHKEEHEEAITWYKKAIEANPINYMAHWFLADAYYSLKRMDEAYAEILWAHVLNRNNPRIMKSLTRILAAKNKSYRTAFFLPAYKLTKQDDNELTVTINTSPEYSTFYAMCKALWLFEPGYKEKMLGERKGVSAQLQEEKECILNIIISETVKEQSSKEITNDPMVDILLRAFENKMVDEAILYEILLARNPRIAAVLTKESITNIIAYLEKVRLK